MPWAEASVAAAQGLSRCFKEPSGRRLVRRSFLFGAGPARGRAGRGVAAKFSGRKAGGLRVFPADTHSPAPAGHGLNPGVCIFPNTDSGCA